MNKNRALMISQRSLIGIALIGMMILSACQAAPSTATQASVPPTVSEGSSIPTEAVEDLSIQDTELEDQGGGSGTAGVTEVDLVDNRFEPEELTIEAGTSVTFRNIGNLAHTVTADDGLFDSGSLKSGDTFTFTFTEAGEYPFYCKPHGRPEGVGMSGVIIVTPGS